MENNKIIGDKKMYDKEFLELLKYPKEFLKCPINHKLVKIPGLPIPDNFSTKDANDYFPIQYCVDKNDSSNYSTINISSKNHDLFDVYINDDNGKIQQLDGDNFQIKSNLRKLIIIEETKTPNAKNNIYNAFIFDPTFPEKKFCNNEKMDICIFGKIEKTNKESLYLNGLLNENDYHQIKVGNWNESFIPETENNMK